MTTWLTIDARNQSGIGVYTLHLLRGLHERGWPVHGLVRRAGAEEPAAYCARTSVVDAPIYSIREQLAVALAARHDPLLHIPHYNIPLLYRGTLLATIHDLTHVLDENYGRGMKARVYARPMLAACARRCAHIFTVSEYSRMRVMEMLGVGPERVTAIHNGVGPEFFPGDMREARASVAARFGLETPYVLYVGNLKPHKNIETLLRAYALLRGERMRDLTVAIVGSDTSGGARLRAVASELKIRPVWIQDARTAELAELYRGAEVLVQPSFEEGFGLPVVEAMACGTPVICSKRGALPEVGGEAAVYFDPRQPEELADTLERVVESSGLRTELRAKGLIRARAFTWERAVDRHVEIYSRFCSASRWAVPA